jgi:hypothetical protein
VQPPAPPPPADNAPAGCALDCEPDTCNCNSLYRYCSVQSGCGGSVVRIGCGAPEDDTTVIVVTVVVIGAVLLIAAVVVAVILVKRHQNK